MSTFGPAYSEALDGERVANAMERVRVLMMDGGWRTIGQIACELNIPHASVSAYLRHLRKVEFGGYRVEKRRSEEHAGLWYYRVLEPIAARDLVQTDLCDFVWGGR